MPADHGKNGAGERAGSRPLARIVFPEYFNAKL